MSTYLYPYKAGSESAKGLAEGLGIKRIALENSKFKGSADKTVINWGASSVSEEVAKCRIINKPENVAIAADKLKFFQRLKTYNANVSRGANAVKFPTFTADPEVARDWVDSGSVVVARTVLNGHSGRGIVVIEKGSEFVTAPLYTVYVPKKQEYRVHVAGGRAVDVQRKARREDVADDQINWRIRNHDNGFIFARNEGLGDVPNTVLTNSVNAIKAIGLDFGAVDVIYNEKHQLSYVLEVNTAPGLSGETLENYVKNMTELVGINEKLNKTKPKNYDLSATLIDEVREPWSLGVGVLRTLGIRDSEYLAGIISRSDDGRIILNGYRLTGNIQDSIVQWFNANSDQEVARQLGNHNDLVPVNWIARD